MTYCKWGVLEFSLLSDEAGNEDLLLLSSLGLQYKLSYWLIHSQFPPPSALRVSLIPFSCLQSEQRSYPI